MKQNVFFLLFALFSINSCVIETARPEKYQSVTILSDCLHHNDKKLFKSFYKTNHIKVKIKYMETDSIFDYLKQTNFNSKADLLILRSSYDAYRASKKNLYNKSYSSFNLDDRFYSQNQYWYGIGLDPYVIVSKKDVDSIPEKYADLITKKFKKQWTTNLDSPTKSIPFLAPFLKNYKRKKIKKKFLQFDQNSIYMGNKLNDYLGAKYFFTNYSFFINEIQENKKYNDKYKANFINQIEDGSYYNLITTGIIKQASNFHNAQLFIEYILQNKTNERLNNHWKTIPISVHRSIHPFDYQNTEFIPTKKPISKQIKNYNIVNSLLKKSKNNQEIEIYINPEPVEVDSLNIEEEDTTNLNN